MKCTDYCFSFFSHSGETIHPLPEDSGMGVEVFAVTVKKNPNFGFHIMGGVDSGGNPYRPDDDGVFITYVASGGAADGLLQPGDKILMVSWVQHYNSIFICFSYKTKLVLRFADIRGVFEKYRDWVYKCFILIDK